MEIILRVSSAILRKKFSYTFYLHLKGYLNDEIYELLKEINLYIGCLMDKEIDKKYILKFDDLKYLESFLRKITSNEKFQILKEISENYIEFTINYKS